MCPPNEETLPLRTRLYWWWRNSYYRLTMLYICVMVTLIFALQIKGMLA